MSSTPSEKYQDITFTYKDLKHIHYPYDYALVVGQKIVNFLVKIILIDTHGSTNIIVLSIFKQIGWKEPKPTKLALVAKQ